jgi:hypothetical protein
MGKPDASRTAEVDSYMSKLQHPFKAEVQAVREIIKGVSPQIIDQIRWNAPSSATGLYGDLQPPRQATRAPGVAHGAMLQDSSGLLEGDYPDRRMMYFARMAEVEGQAPGARGPGAAVPPGDGSGRPTSIGPEGSAGLGATRSTAPRLALG